VEIGWQTEVVVMTHTQQLASPDARIPTQGPVPRPASVVREGAIAGARAATAVALAFVVADLLAGPPLFTAGLLGVALAKALGLAAVAQSIGVAALAYTLFHFAAFMAVGVAAAGVARLARREPTVLAGALLVFAVIEVGFYVLLALLQDRTLTGALTWVQIAAGNVVGAAVIGATLWRAHPELRREFRFALAGSD